MMCVLCRGEIIRENDGLRFVSICAFDIHSLSCVPTEYLPPLYFMYPGFLDTRDKKTINELVICETRLSINFVFFSVVLGREYFY